MPKKDFSTSERMNSPVTMFLPAEAQAKPETAEAAPAATEAPRKQITRRAAEYKAKVDPYEPRTKRVQLLMRPRIYESIRSIAKHEKQSMNNLIETVLEKYIEQTKAQGEQTKRG